MTEKYCVLLEDDDRDEFLIEIDFKNNVNISIFLIKESLIDKLKFIFKLLFVNKNGYEIKSKGIDLSKYQIDEIKEILDEYEITYYRQLDEKRKNEDKNV